nr:arginine N-succinyltransferase [Sphingomonas sp. SCN 67-18]
MMMVRPASARDVDGMYRLARAAGPGLTNLPPDRDALAERIACSERTLAGAVAAPGDQQVRLVLEADGALLGVAAIWPRIGQDRPFYSYQLSELSHLSRSTGRRVAHRMLTLVSTLSGASEVGGLLLDPAARGSGAGKLLARSRYLFIARHRALFADRVVAELRGYQDAEGRSPFWEAVGRPFYDLDFEEADRLSGIPDHPIIEELGPKYPLYVNMLPRAARDAINRPHDQGCAALAMLRAEGFSFGNFIDIFDAGPTVVCDTAQIRSIAGARAVTLEAGRPGDGAPAHLVAAGAQADFRCTILPVDPTGAVARIDGAALAGLGGAQAEAHALPL